MANKRVADNLKTRWKLSRHRYSKHILNTHLMNLTRAMPKLPNDSFESIHIRSAAGPPEEKLKKLRSSRDLASIKNLPKKTSKSNKRKMKIKGSATVVKASVMETAMLAAHIAPPRRAAAATAQAISEAQQVIDLPYYPMAGNTCLFR